MKETTQTKAIEKIEKLKEMTSLEGLWQLTAPGCSELVVFPQYAKCVSGIIFKHAAYPALAMDYGDVLAKTMESSDDPSFERAQEYIEFNMLAAYLGVGTPAFFERFFLGEEWFQLHDLENKMAFNAGVVFGCADMFKGMDEPIPVYLLPEEPEAEWPELNKEEDIIYVPFALLSVMGITAFKAYCSKVRDYVGISI